MTLVTGPGQAPGQPGGEDPGRGGEQAKTTNPSASSQPLGAERHDVNVTMPGATDTTATQASLDHQGRVTFPLPQGARVMPSEAPAEVIEPTTTEEELNRLGQRKASRRGFLFGVIGIGVATAAGVGVIASQKGRGQAPQVTVPSGGGATTGAPEVTASPEPQPVEAYPGNPEGNTPLDVTDSWCAALEWSLNNAHNTNADGRTGLELIERVLFMPKAPAGDYRTEEEISSSMFSDLARNFAKLQNLEAQGLDMLQTDPYLRVSFLSEPGDSMFIPGDQTVDFSDPDFNRFALAGTLRVTWRNPTETAPVPLNSIWVHPSMSLKGTYAFSEGQGARNGVSDFDGWQMSLFKAPPREGQTVVYPYVYMDGRPVRPY